ncbi:MAG: ROK family protein [Planctomycetota bacterium]|nr:ROK family protein [Planctomycetota bacterium]MDA1105387.1 ROK family protein [Planctomycetota bacterium]
MRVLTIDVGGTHVKVRVPDVEEKRRFPSGKALTAPLMAEGVKEIAKDWAYDCVSIGLPTPIDHCKPVHEPHNLGGGWVDFDYAGAFGVPVRLINDAAMQALGHDNGGRMLFLGLGTGLGTAIVVDHRVLPCELAHLQFRKGKTFEEEVGEAALERKGKERWAKRVFEMIDTLRAAIQVDEVVIGGGNVRNLDELPAGCRRGENALAFEGGFRLWRNPWTAALDADEHVLAPKAGRGSAAR